MISLIATVYNEKDNLDQWLDGLLRQTKLPDELVIVDGGSSDVTWDKLTRRAEENKLIKVFQHPGNIAAGRNFAIQQAQGDIIAVTDAGCIYDVTWLEKLVAPLAGDASWSATGFGPWFKDGDNILIYLIAAATIPAPNEFTKPWLPSSRSVAFKKEVWEKAGGYPEWIPICEDIIFDLNIIRKIGQPEFIREPLVFWRPRTTLKSYFNQLFKYTKSDGHGKLWLNRQLTRYVVYLLSLWMLFLSFSFDWKFILILAVGVLLYSYKFWQRWFVYAGKLSFGQKIFGVLLVPFIVAFGDLAKMAGWPVGVWERLSGKIKFPSS